MSLIHMPLNIRCQVTMRCVCKARVTLRKSIGPLKIFNPLMPNMHYDLNFWMRDERLLARFVLELAAKEYPYVEAPSLSAHRTGTRHGVLLTRRVRFGRWDPVFSLPESLMPRTRTKKGTLSRHKRSRRCRRRGWRSHQMEVCRPREGAQLQKSSCSLMPPTQGRIAMCSPPLSTPQMDL